jgi:acetate kinase
MKILILNCGSSSIKYQLIDMPQGEVLAKGGVERIGESEGILKHKTAKGQKVLNEVYPTHADGLKRVFELLCDNDPLKDVSEIGAVGHRVVHGGEALTKTCLVNQEIIDAIDAVYPLDPLHVPAHVLGLNVAKDLLPGVPNVAVFDTSFHQTIPEHAYLYAIPYSLYTEDHIRRYGAHGTSHMYVANRMAKLLNKPIEDLNIITCHLGNGSSITAVKGGKSIDTSMGLTPLEGLVMGTRCGDIDPAVLTYLGRTKNMNADELDNLINKKSGLLGLSGISNDCRVLEDLVAEGNEAATRAMNVFNYRIVKYIGAYAMVLGHVDAIVFTAGIGENSPYVRGEVCQKLELLGVDIDMEANDCHGKERKLSTDKSKVEVWVIPTNEELAIAQQTYELIK